METINDHALDLENCMLDLFHDVAARLPDALALVYEDEQLTYGELNRRANQLAHHLLSIGVTAGMLVGVSVSRSLDMVVGILGILKAGGAYVPLDPTYPAERLSFILEDAGARVVVTQRQYLPSFSQQQVQTVCLDADRHEIAKYPGDTPFKNVSGENLAYVIYTSGSTGKPKGVMISHSNLYNFIRIAGSALDVNADDVYLQTASISYALSVRQLMIPLARGATMVVATSEQLHDPLLLFQLIKDSNITLMDVVPSFWRACLQRLSDLPAAESRNLMDNSLRRIVSIGEALLSDLPRDWFSHFGHKTELVNIFGQTETTGVVATYPIPSEAPARVSIVPIGRSVPDTKLYLLDAQLAPVPVGEQGELCVSSPCVAVGYLNRPELSAEKFIVNPFHDGFSERLYRTGDMARMREDGTIEFLGRGDHQVKIRGQRLELGEVEAAIRGHHAVGECVVLARGDNPDEKYLVAYVVPVANGVLGISELRDFVRARLPDYMVPATFAFLDSMPLTPNGKIDRLALPDPLLIAADGGPSSDIRDEPRSPVERIIAEIWQDLLKLERIGIHDNYFDLGGYSLMSVRMFARIERELGVRLPYTSLFHAATIAQIAELVVSTDEEVTQWKTIVPIQTHGDKHPFFGVHGHEGGVLFWRDIVAHLPKNQPFYALQARGVDGIQPPLNNIPAMAALYINEMREIQPLGPYYIGGYSMGGEIAFEMAQQLVNQGESVNLLVMFDTRNPKRSIRPMTRTDEKTIIPQLDASVPSGRYHILKKKISGHYLRWSALGSRKKVEYIINQIMTRLSRLILVVLVRFFKIIRRRLPETLLLRYLRKNHSEALVNYVPVIYPGKITLFRATETVANESDDSPLGWKPLARGGLEVHYFEASHEILGAKYAKDVACTLTECLRKARGE